MNKEGNKDDMKVMRMKYGDGKRIGGIDSIEGRERNKKIKNNVDMMILEMEKEDKRIIEGIGRILGKRK